MAKRCIYFIKDGMLYKKTFEVSWDNDSMTVNKTFCSDYIFKQSDKFMQPCVDVSGASDIQLHKELTIFGVKDNNGNTISKLWDILRNNTNQSLLPPGSYELIYLKNLNERQLNFALSVKSFYDIYHNPEKYTPTPAKALAALQLLYNQGKIDYVNNIEMFLWWYMINCDNPAEWVNIKHKE